MAYFGTFILDGALQFWISHAFAKAANAKAIASGRPEPVDVDVVSTVRVALSDDLHCVSGRVVGEENMVTFWADTKPKVGTTMAVFRQKLDVPVTLPKPAETSLLAAALPVDIKPELNQLESMRYTQYPSPYAVEAGPLQSSAIDTCLVAGAMLSVVALLPPKYGALLSAVVFLARQPVRSFKWFVK